MNILYICHYAGTPKYGGADRIYHMSREWVKMEHNVMVLAASYTHVQFVHPDEIKEKNIEDIDGIKYLWYPTPRYNKNGFARFKNILSFLIQVYKDSKRISRDFMPDIVIASSIYPMDIWPAKRIADMSGAKLIFELHDLWPLSPIIFGGMSPKHPFILLCKRAEKDCYKYSDKVVSLLPCVHEYVRKFNYDLNNLIIISNGIVEEDWLPENIVNVSNQHLKSFLDNEREKKNVIVGYAGAFGKANALEYLIDAADILRNKNISFVLVGDGLEKENLIKKVEELKLQNIFFFDFIPKREIPDLLNYVDIAYIGWQNVFIYKYGISPNKLMDYMMSSKAILHSVNTGNDIVSKVGCGITVAPASSKMIAEGILKLASLRPEEREEMGKRGRNYILKNQTYALLAKKFLTIMKD